MEFPLGSINTFIPLLKSILIRVLCQAYIHIFYPAVSVVNSQGCSNGTPYNSGAGDLKAQTSKQDLHSLYIMPVARSPPPLTITVFLFLSVFIIFPFSGLAEAVQYIYFLASYTSQNSIFSSLSDSDKYDGCQHPFPR